MWKSDRSIAEAPGGVLDPLDPGVDALDASVGDAVVDRVDQPLKAPFARPSWSLLAAAALAVVGLVRLASDLITDSDPTWVTFLGDSPLRLLARTTDGSVAGNLNVQYFKVMAIPCGLAVVFLVNGGLTGGFAAAERRWASAQFRLTCIAALALLCTLCEIEKATHLLGLPTGLVEGERWWLNHVVHAIGGVVAYPLSNLFRYRARETMEHAAPPTQEGLELMVTIRDAELEGVARDTDS